jgi:hypothetical protein
MMGLERLLTGLYGTVPQLDMDQQFARARVIRPMELDFARLADGIKRNNVGTAGITLDATAEVKDGKVVLQPTGQSFQLEGSAPASPGAARRKLKVHEWTDPAKTRLEILP